MEKIKIGNLTLKNNIFLAPMVDVTDLAFRELCRKEGASMTYTEMIYINAILHENNKTLSLLKTNKKDSPIGLQITGNNENEFKKFSKLDILNNYDLIDINCGCPSIRITENEAGSYLLNNPNKIGKMIKILKDQNLTVTAKIRLGFKKNNVLEVAKTIEKAGAEAITLHARLANQSGKIPANWSWIKKLKEKSGIPIIGNGDIFSGKDAQSMFNQTNCDGVMVARGAIGNPQIFKQITNYLKTGKETTPTTTQRINSFKEYIKLTKKYDIIDLGRIKYVGNNFLKGFKGATKERQQFTKLKTFKEIENFVKSL